MTLKEVEHEIDRARAVSREGDYATALEILTLLGEKYPDRYEPLLARSAVLRGSGDIEGAFADLAAAIVLAPDESAPYFRRGRWNLEIGNFESAVKDLSEVISRRQEYFLEAAFYFRAQGFLKLGMSDEAMCDCEQISDGYRLGPMWPSKEDILKAAKATRSE